ncbi:hypothetical protein [Sagittula sp. S175]|uniref:hypothetical protein n=1 Tax=Sagittula sp. S175 TaxID=3415129 RepID=UPI003C79D4EE
MLEIPWYLPFLLPFVLAIAVFAYARSLSPDRFGRPLRRMATLHDWRYLQRTDPGNIRRNTLEAFDEGWTLTLTFRLGQKHTPAILETDITLPQAAINGFAAQLSDRKGGDLRRIKSHFDPKSTATGPGILFALTGHMPDFPDGVRLIDSPVHGRLLLAAPGSETALDAVLRLPEFTPLYRRKSAYNPTLVRSTQGLTLRMQRLPQDAAHLEAFIKAGRALARALSTSPPKS